MKELRDRIFEWLLEALEHNKKQGRNWATTTWGDKTPIEDLQYCVEKLKAMGYQVEFYDARGEEFSDYSYVLRVEE